LGAHGLGQGTAEIDRQQQAGVVEDVLPRVAVCDEYVPAETLTARSKWYLSSASR
jgi:hypothetical protein